MIEQYGAADEEGNSGVVYQGIRNDRYAYVEQGTGEVELYDLDNDPFQLVNLRGDPAYGEVEARLAARLDALRACAGPSCRTKPVLKLKLPRSKRVEGRSCRSPRNFVAKVRGADAGAIELATFGIGAKRDGRDRDAPIKERLKAKTLKRKRRPEIRVVAELVDGRELSLQKRVRICRER